MVSEQLIRKLQQSSKQSLENLTFQIYSAQLSEPWFGTYHVILRGGGGGEVSS